jgi:hypothetical protein
MRVYPSELIMHFSLLSYYTSTRVHRSVGTATGYGLEGQGTGA